MRARELAALLHAVAVLSLGACAPRAQPYRFSMPMLGRADVPAETLGPAAPRTSACPVDECPAAGRPSRPGPGRPSSGRARPTYAYGWQTDAQSGIRTVSARGIELHQPGASAEAAQAVTQSGVARAALARDGETPGVAWSRLPAPHRSASTAISAGQPVERRDPAGVTGAIELPWARGLREPADLRARVGTRDKRDPFAIVMGWLAELGVSLVDRGTVVDMAKEVVALPTDGPALVAWAEARGKLVDRTEVAAPGDLLVFDRATGHDASALVALVIARDARGVTEVAYAGGGVIRRGFVDASRPSTRRDLTGRVVNTFLRHGKHWPPKGTRYLAGELLAHVIRTR